MSDYGPKRTFILYDNGGFLVGDPMPRVQVTADPIGTAWWVDVNWIRGVMADTGDPVTAEPLLQHFLMDRDKVRDLTAVVRWLARITDYLTTGQLGINAVDEAQSEPLDVRWSAREVTE